MRWQRRIFHFETLEKRILLAADHTVFDFGKGPLLNVDNRAIKVVFETFTQERGHGWLDVSRLSSRDRSLFSLPGVDALHLDSVIGVGGKQSTFRIAVEDGEYDLRVFLGDAVESRDNMLVFINGQHADEISTSRGHEFGEVRHTIEVQDGIVDIAFDDIGGNPYWSLNGIEITRIHHEPTDPTQPTDPTDPGQPTHPGHGQPHGSIPEFAAAPTITAIANGAWSNPAVWNTNRVPAADDIVVIPNHVSIEVAAKDAIADVLSVHGYLRFNPNVHTTLRVSTLQVHSDGTLEIGTAANPISASAQLIIRDTPLDLQQDPEQFGIGLLVEGKISIHGGEKTTFERLAEEPLAGATKLRFAAPVSGWEIGDAIYLPDTRQYGTSDPAKSQFEVVTITSISNDGLTATLADPLAFNHFGARDGAGVLAILPHVANLSRNVEIASENPTGTRGHTLYTGRADVDIAFAEFNDLGRTTSDALDSTAFHPDGSVAHVGTNQIGRYSIHIHHLDGPTTPQPEGHQFTVVGAVSNGGVNSTDDTALHNFKWGMAVHDSHYGLIQDNIFLNWAGAGFAFEDGNEFGNVVDHNFASRIWGHGAREDSDANEITAGYGFWFVGISNRMTDNVVATTFKDAKGVTSFGFVLGNFGSGTVFVPDSPGSQNDLAVPRFGHVVAEFSGNEAYSTSKAFTVWNLGSATEISYLRDVVAWHYGRGFYTYPVQNMTIDGLTLLGQYNAPWDFRPESGFSGGDYANASTVVTNANIQNNRVGFSPSTDTRGTSTILTDSYLRNYTNLFFDTLYTSGDPKALGPRTVLVDNVVFDAILGQPVVNFDMYYRHQNVNRNYQQRNQLVVRSFDGITGDDFQVFFRQQAPDFVMQQSTNWSVVGSPEAGLTNQENWDEYGISIAGAVAPSNATKRDGINGLVAPLD